MKGIYVIGNGNNDKSYVIIEQNRTPSEKTGDYFIIPKSLLVKKRR